MAAPSVPALPAKLKSVQHYMKTANEHDKRDPVIAYYCRLYAMQRAMEIDKKSPECRMFLVGLMDYLEVTKRNLQSEEAIHNEVVGQAHVENYALKVFLYADNEDRAARFNKNVVKSFYTAGMLFDVLTVFGELSEDLIKNQKYAKWKAAYIHRCLKDGETPIPGPLPEEGQDEFGGGNVGFEGISQPGPPSGMNLPTVSHTQYPNDNSLSTPSAGTYAPPTTPQDPPQMGYQPPPAAYQPPTQPVATPSTWVPPANPAGVQLTAQDYQKAMKFCKHASSALQYEDSKTAVENLQKALQLLTTGTHS